MNNKKDDLTLPTRRRGFFQTDQLPELPPVSDSESVLRSNVTSLKEFRQIIVVIRGLIEYIPIRDDLLFVLGRRDNEREKKPDIDLSPYGAHRYGVSRSHALLQIIQQHLYITDLRSTNGTYLNGNRIPSLGTEQIHKGDEVRLGLLAMKIIFR